MLLNTKDPFDLKAIKTYYLLIVSLLFFSVLIILSGCKQTSHEKICIQAVDNLPHELIPGVYHSYSEMQIYSQVYEPLLQLSDDYKTILPNLAESWSYSSGNLHLTIRLKPDIIFHDQRRLDSRAAIHCIEWIQRTCPESLYLSNIDSVFILDSLTFRMVLKKPDARFLYFLTTGYGIVLFSPHDTGSAHDQHVSFPAGTGPFRVKTRKDDRIILQKFGLYRNSSGNMAELVFRLFPYSAQLEKALERGEIDMVYMVRQYALDRLRWSGKIGYIVNEPLHCNMIAFNLKHPKLSDPLLRKRILTAIDLKRLTIYHNRGAAITATNPLPPVYKYFKDIKQAAYDSLIHSRLTKEKRDSVIHLTLYYPEYSFIRPTYLEAIKSYLEKRQIYLDVVYFTSSKTYEQAIRRDDAELFFYGWRSDILGDAGNYLWSLFYSDSPYNLFNYRNSSVDRQLEKALNEFDNKKRNQYYRAVVEEIVGDMPAIFLKYIKEYYAYNSIKIRALSMTPYGIINSKDVIINDE